MSGTGRVQMIRRDERGSAVLEWPLASLLLLIPVAIMVILLPTWSERQTVARDAATAAAREAVLASTPEEALASGESAATRTAENFGIDPADVSVSWDGDLSRGGSVTATVTIRMPAIIVPGWGWRRRLVMVGQSHGTSRRLQERRLSARRKDERGSVTLWILGLILPTLLLGGISLDLWRGFSERRALAGIADAAAVAGANGVDTDYFYETDEVRLDPDLAEQLAIENLAAQLDDRSLDDWEVVATTDSVTVRVRGTVDLSLLKLFYEDSWDIEADATARPQPIG